MTQPKLRIGITGGAGSLGRAFVRLLHKDHDVIVIDSNEWASVSLSKDFPNVPVVVDDFDNWNPATHPVDVMIHCAAYKHVGVGQDNPVSCITNNIIKTNTLFSKCLDSWADILFISTDKAVEPISTYGFSKALGEKLAWYYDGSVARLGNILNSSGSVIPIWEEAIENNQPIPITDESMTRFVIEDSDAASQVWAGYMTNHKLIVPSMPEQRLLDILSDVLKRHGFASVADYKPGVTIIGVRQGEKLHEKLTWDTE